MKTGRTLATFSLSGKIPFFNEIFIILDRGSAMIFRESLMTVMAMLSQSGTFPDLNELQISLTSWVLVDFRIMDLLTVLGKKDQKE